MVEEQQESGKGHGAWNNEQWGHWLTHLLILINCCVESVVPLGTAVAGLKSRGRPPSVGFHLCIMGKKILSVWRMLPMASSPGLECFTS